MIPNIEFGSGKLYMAPLDGGETVELSTLNGCSIESDDVAQEVYVNKIGLEQTFEIFARVSKDIIDAIDAILGFTHTVLEQCPNRRVVHLARYAKKRRTRKKNLHRAFRILEETNV